MIKAILAHGLNYEIGEKGDLPWGKGIPKDLEYFKDVTKGNIVVMGSNTWKSLPFFPKGFPSRYNYVITSDGYGQQESGIIKISGDSFLNCLKTGESIFHHKQDTWVVGGASIYKQLWDYVDEVHITTVEESYPNADTFFKPDLSLFEKKGLLLDVSSDSIKASVQVWSRIKS